MEPTPLVQMLTAMTEFNQYRRPSVEEIIRRYYSNDVPQWRDYHFGPRTLFADPICNPLHRPRPDLSAVASLPQNGIFANIPSDEILASAGEGEEEITVPEEILPPMKAISVHSQDSGQATFTDSRDVYTVSVTVVDGERDMRFPCESTELGAHIYRVVLYLLKISGGLKLWYGNILLGFHTPLSEFHQREVRFVLERLAALETRSFQPRNERQRTDSMTVEVSPDAMSPSVEGRLFSLTPEADRQHIRNRSTNRDLPDDSLAPQILMGAAYNGDDHVVLEDSPGGKDREAQQGTLQSNETTLQPLVTPLRNHSEERQHPLPFQSPPISVRNLPENQQQHTLQPIPIPPSNQPEDQEYGMNTDNGIQQHCRERFSVVVTTHASLPVGACSVDSDTKDVDDVESGEDDVSRSGVSEGEESTFVENEEDDDANKADQNSSDSARRHLGDASQEGGDNLVNEEEPENQSADEEDEQGSQSDSIASDEGHSEFEDSGVVAPDEVSANSSTFSDMNLNITDEAPSPICEECPDLQDDEED